MSLHPHFLTRTELKPVAIEVMQQYRQTGRIDLTRFLSALNGYERYFNVRQSTLEEMIDHPKSKYHLLFSLSGARMFEAELLTKKFLTA